MAAPLEMAVDEVRFDGNKVQVRLKGDLKRKWRDLAPSKGEKPRRVYGRIERALQRRSEVRVRVGCGKKGLAFCRVWTASLTSQQ